MVLVTGGSGFLGGHLLRYLSAEGVTIRALYHNHAPQGELANLPNVTWMQCDLLDVYGVEEAMEGVKDIYHCAAIVSYSPKDRDEMLHFNPESTANIVNQAIVQGIRKMVYVSSIASLSGRGGANAEINEDQEWAESKYNSAYGLSKYLAENEVWRGIGEGLSAVIVNPSVILGAGDWDRGSSRLMTVVNKEFPFYTNGVSGWVGVKDVVKVMVQLMKSDKDSERYIVNEGNHAFREIFAMMAKELGRKPPRYYAGAFLTGIVWRLSSLYSALTGKAATITRETARTAHGQSYYNNQKLLAALPGFVYTPIDECIKEMAQSFVADSNKKKA